MRHLAWEQWYWNNNLPLSSTSLEKVASWSRFLVRTSDEAARQAPSTWSAEEAEVWMTFAPKPVCAWGGDPSYDPPLPLVVRTNGCGQPHFVGHEAPLVSPPAGLPGGAAPSPAAATASSSWGDCYPSTASSGRGSSPASSVPESRSPTPDRPTHCGMDISLD
jgi:hypothetical protein